MKVIIGLFLVAIAGIIDIAATDASVASGCVGFKCRFQNSALDGFDSFKEEPLRPDTTQPITKLPYLTKIPYPIMSGSLEG